MSVTLLWVATPPTTEVSNCFAFLHSARLLDSSRFASSSRDRSALVFREGRRQKYCKSRSINTDFQYGSSISNIIASPAGETEVSSEEKVYNVVLKQAALVTKEFRSRGNLDVKPGIVLPGNLSLLSEAYDRCAQVCEEYAKTFYLG